MYGTIKKKKSALIFVSSFFSIYSRWWIDTEGQPVLLYSCNEQVSLTKLIPTERFQSKNQNMNQAKNLRQRVVTNFSTC